MACKYSGVGHLHLLKPFHLNDIDKLSKWWVLRSNVAHYRSQWFNWYYKNFTLLGITRNYSRMKSTIIPDLDIHESHATLRSIFWHENSLACNQHVSFSSYDSARENTVTIKRLVPSNFYDDPAGDIKNVFMCNRFLPQFYLWKDQTCSCYMCCQLTCSSCLCRCCQRVLCFGDTAHRKFSPPLHSTCSPRLLWGTTLRYRINRKMGHVRGQLHCSPHHVYSNPICK